MNLSYDVICSVELWSHVFPTLIRWFVSMFNKKEKNKKVVEPSFTLSIGIATIILLSPPICLYTCRLFSNPTFLTSLTTIIPLQLSKTLQYMFPIQELHASYDIIHSFVSDKAMLHDMLCHLLFVTAHIQVGLGHIGIAFLTSEQRRKNMLIRMDVDNPSPSSFEEGNENGDASSDGSGKKKKGKENGASSNNKNKKFDPSLKFRRSAPTFILFTVLPYMFQIILFGKFVVVWCCGCKDIVLMLSISHHHLHSSNNHSHISLVFSYQYHSGNLNKFAFIQVQNQIHRSVRIHELFDHDSHLTALASDGATSPDVYASSMDTVVATGENKFRLSLID